MNLRTYVTRSLVATCSALALAGAFASEGAAPGSASRESAAAPAASDAAAVKRLEAFAAGTPAAEGAFVQTNFYREGQVTLKASGTFAFSRPGRFDWVYLEPYDQRIVSDGTTLRLYDADLMQVTEKRLEGAIDATPAAILFGNNDFSRDWIVRELPAEGGEARIEARPKTSGAFERVVIGWSAAGLPSRMTLVDAFGQETELVFTEFNRTTPDAKRFELVVPEGTDVLTDSAF